METSSIWLFTLAKQINNGQNMKLYHSILYSQAIAVKMSQSQAQSSISLPDAQPDSFCEFFKPPSPELSEIQEGSLIDFEPETLRDKRIAIKTALLFKIPHADIREKLNVTEKQIIYARNHQLTPQKSKTGKYRV